MSWQAAFHQNWACCLLWSLWICSTIPWQEQFPKNYPTLMTPWKFSTSLWINSLGLSQKEHAPRAQWILTATVHCAGVIANALPRIENKSVGFHSSRAKRLRDGYRLRKEHASTCLRFIPAVLSAVNVRPSCLAGRYQLLPLIRWERTSNSIYFKPHKPGQLSDTRSMSLCNWLRTACLRAPIVPGNSTATS